MAKFFGLVYVKVFLIAMAVLTVGSFLTLDNRVAAGLLYLNFLSSIFTLVTLYLIKYHPNFVNWVTVVFGLIASVGYYFYGSIVDGAI